jgi:DUF4097 and DUF4098 domain-containing protein YvlB
MKKGIKISLIIAAVLVVIGLSIVITVLAVNDFDYELLNGSGKVETKEALLIEEFNNINIDVEVIDVNLIKTNDPTCKIIYDKRENSNFEISVVDNTLKIRETTIRKFYFFTGFGFKKTKMEVYLPKDTYNKLVLKSATSSMNIPKDFTFDTISINSNTGHVNLFAKANEITIKVDTGKVQVKDITANNIDIETSTGSHALENITVANLLRVNTDTGTLTLKNVSVHSLRAGTSTGRVYLTNVVATNRFDINTSTGSIFLTDSDAEEIYIKTSTGNVSGTILTSKIFYCKANNGKVNVPRTTTGGICEITTDTGSINLTIVNP